VPFRPGQGNTQLGCACLAGMALAEANLLAQFRSWRVFGTGTFAGCNIPGPSAQRRLSHAFLYRAASDVFCVPFRKLVWCLRYEMGEKLGRGHYHWLIGGRFKASISHCFMLNALWDSLPRCGFSRNHVFDQRLNGIAYVAKCLASETQGGSLAGDFYESGKFGTADHVTLSNSFVRSVGGRRVGVLRYGVCPCGKKGAR
jgi:hypothetical protein